MAEVHHHQGGGASTGVQSGDALMKVNPESDGEKKPLRLEFRVEVMEESGADDAREPQYACWMLMLS